MCLEEWHIPLQGTSLFSAPAIDIERIREYHQAKNEGMNELADREEEEREREKTHAKLKEQLRSHKYNR